MQSTPVAPSVVLSQGGDRKQVPLRDYLNSRIAPFLKKAMTQSLEVEAEYPLQFLGECLINQSILYEANPDTTNIKERFRYNFEAPAAVQEDAMQAKVNGMEEVAVPEPQTVTTAPSEPPATDEQTMTNGERNAEATIESSTAEEKQEAAGTLANDTVMGGTS